MPQSNKFQYNYNLFKPFLNLTDGMIVDKRRNQVYKDWIDSVDVKDKVVLDAGAGLGLWGHYVLQKGAKKVIQVEVNYSRYSFLQHLKKESKFNDKIEIINANLLSDFKCDKPDIVISEFIGDALLNESMEVLPHLKNKWPEAIYIFEYGQYEISWSLASVELLHEYLYTTKEITNYNYVENFKMPDYYSNSIRNLYESFQLPTCSRIFPKKFVDQSFYTAKGPIFSFCEKNNESLEFGSKIPEGYENKNLFATLTLSVGTDMNKLSTLEEMGFCGMASFIKKSNNTNINFKYDPQKGWWNINLR